MAVRATKLNITQTQTLPIELNLNLKVKQFSYKVNQALWSRIFTLAISLLKFAASHISNIYRHCLELPSIIYILSGIVEGLETGTSRPFWGFEESITQNGLRTSKIAWYSLEHSSNFASCGRLHSVAAFTQIIRQTKLSKYDNNTLQGWRVIGGERR